MVSPRVRESKTVLDSGFHVVDSGFVRVSIVGFRFFYLNSGFQNPGFRIPMFYRIPDSTSKNFPDFGRYRETGNKNVRLATMLQNELNSDVGRFTTRVQTCKQPDLLQDRFYNAQHRYSSRLQQCCKTSCTFFVARFSVPLRYSSFLLTKKIKI